MQAILVNQKNNSLQTYIPLKKTLLKSTLKMGTLELSDKESRLTIKTKVLQKQFLFLLFRIIPWSLVTLGILGMLEIFTRFPFFFTNWMYLGLAILGGILFFVPIHSYDFIEDGVYYRNVNYFHFSVQTPLFISKNATLFVDIETKKETHFCFSCHSTSSNFALFSFEISNQHTIHEINEIAATVLHKLKECNEVHFKYENR